MAAWSRISGREREGWLDVPMIEWRQAIIRASVTTNGLQYVSMVSMLFARVVVFSRLFELQAWDDL